MAYPSLRERHRPVVSVPDSLTALYQSMQGRKAKALLTLLLRSPKEVVIGSYEWRTRAVFPHDEALGCLPFLDPTGRFIPVDILDCAVLSLQGMMRYHRLPVGVWRTREAGKGGLPRGKRGGYGYVRERVPYRIGLVARPVGKSARRLRARQD